MKICVDCEEEVGDTPNDEPCPHCGKLSKRNIIVHVPTAVIAIHAIAPTVVIVRHWNKLLDAADRLHASGEYGVSVVAAATACEVVVDRAMTKAFAAKGVADLEKPVMDLVFTCSLAGDKNRKLYTALTGDDITRKGFWQGYRQMVQRRNETVHSGHDVPAADARQDIDAARLFVEHVERVNGLA